MCWAAGQASAIHGHEGSRCFVKVLAGQLLETQLAYPQPSEVGALELGAVGAPSKRWLSCDDVTYIDDSIGLHQVANRSASEPAITLHVYLPAYTKCRVFESPSPESGGISLERSKTIDVTFNTRPPS